VEEIMYESTPVQAPAKKKLPVWAIILIILGVLLLCTCLCVLLFPAILAMMGPSIGNVFSNIIEQMPTP
jgi:hypothetical protein